MAMSLKELTKALKNEEFVARTDEELQKEATGRYTEVYDTLRGTAQQRQQTIDAAYQQELQSLADTLAGSREAVGQAAARGNAAINDYIYGRNMQRTSYGAASEGSVTDAMNKAAAALAQQYNTASSGVENNRVLLAEQLAGTLAQYDKDYLADVQAYIDRQKQIDYDRKVAADAAYNDIQMALYEYGKGRSGGGGGGRRYGGSGSVGTSPVGGNVIDAVNRLSAGDPTAASRQAASGVNPTFGTSHQNTKTATVNPTFGTSNQNTKGGKLLKK